MVFQHFLETSFIETFLTAKANSLLNTFGDSGISFGRIIAIPVNFLLSIIKVFSHYKQKPLEGGYGSCEFSHVSFETTYQLPLLLLLFTAFIFLLFLLQYLCSCQ